MNLKKTYNTVIYHGNQPQTFASKPPKSKSSTCCFSHLHLFFPVRFFEKNNTTQFHFVGAEGNVGTSDLHSSFFNRSAVAKISAFQKKKTTRAQNRLPGPSSFFVPRKKDLLKRKGVCIIDFNIIKQEDHNQPKEKSP